MKKSADRRKTSTTEMRRHGESRRSSGFSDHTITRDYQITRSPSGLAVLRNAGRILRATFREIFDESAYDRFLTRTRAPRTTASYRQFTQECDAAIPKKPRCC